MTAPKAIIICACIIGAGVAMVGCGDDKTEHYYAMCKDPDGNGWPLADVEKNEKGNIIGCAYQRPANQLQPPDEPVSYTVYCTETGCEQPD